jgi:hypothetical protein
MRPVNYFFRFFDFVLPKNMARRPTALGQVHWDLGNKPNHKEATIPNHRLRAGVWDP